ncbi:TPA: hypothetical protein MH263_06305 [Klebsiella pneumoniae]|nr:hypothetical protein [Klebsiella pneumoniae]
MQIISSRCIIRTFHSHEIDSFMVYRNDAEWMKYQGFKGLTKEDYEAELLGVLTLVRGIQLAIVNKLTQCFDCRGCSSRKPYCYVCSVQTSG